MAGKKRQDTAELDFDFSQEEFEDYNDYDAEKKSGGFLSKLKRKKKDNDDDGYDIFDLDDPFEEIRAKRNARIEKEEKKRKEKREKEEKKLQQQRINERKQRAAELSERRALRAKRMAEQEEDDVKIYGGEESDANESYDSDEYSVDEINKVLASVGLTPLSSVPDNVEKDSSFEVEEEASVPNENTANFDFSEEIEAENSQDDAVSSTQENNSETKIIDRTAVFQAIDSSVPEQNQEQSEEHSEEKTDDTEKVSGKTRLFDIKKILSSKRFDTQSDLKSKGRKKKFIENFRVLEKPVQDKPILERAPLGSANANVADSIDTDEYDDIFQAVEQNEKFDTKTIQSNVLKENAQKKKVSASAVIKELKEKESGQKTKFYILIGITALSVILSLISAAYKPDGALQFMFGSDARVFSAINLLLFAAGAVICLDFIKLAVRSLKKLEFNSGVCTFLISAAALMHLLVSLIAGMNEITGFAIFTPFALFAMLSERMAQLIFDKNLLNNLSMLVKNKSLNGLQPIDNETDADVLGYGLGGKNEPVIYYSAEAALPSDIEKASNCNSTDEPLYGMVGIAVLVLSLVAGLAFTILHKSTVPFAALFMGAICLSFPSFKKLINVLLSKDSSAFSSKSGSCVLSFDYGVRFGESHAFIIDSESLFKANVSKFRAVPRGAITQSDCVVFTAAALKNTRSLIRSCFDDFLEETGIELPEAQEVQYEENLGYSAWIAERRVLVGNREMLSAHNVECPGKEEEDAYSKGRKVLYLAVEGAIAATFIVTYSERHGIKKSAQKLSKNGVVLMISSSDPFISEKDISLRLGIELAAIKVVNTKGAEILAAYQKPTVKRYDNGLLCSKKYENTLSLVNSAISLSRAHKLSRFVYLLGCAASFILFVVLTPLGVNGLVTAPAAILFQCAWCAIAYFAGRTRLEKNP